MLYFLSIFVYEEARRFVEACIYDLKRAHASEIGML